MAMAGDTINAEAQRERERRDARTRYIKIAEKEPTRENLVASIKVEGARGKAAGAAIAALTLMALDDAPDESLVPDILLCYKNNPKNWTVRTNCARALLHVKKDEGVKLARTILADDNANLETKLVTGIYLVKVDELDGYRLLPEGLLSDKTIEERLARDLLELFRKFDGVKVPATSQTVDIEKVLAEVEAQKAEKSGADKPGG